MTKRRVKRTPRVALESNLAAEKQQLTAAEWMVVASVPMLMIGAIRIIAIFYTFALTLMLVGGYFIIAIRDSHFAKPKLHLVATTKYLLIVTLITIAIYIIL